MEITKQNFNEELDNIIKSIEDCSFLAIDGEFTGLDSGQYGPPAPFDTLVERYSKIRNGASDFLLIQFGLCTFKADQDKQKYEAKPYNFYIFPRPYTRNAPDRRFLCQSSSIDFLASQGFDFNKLFKEGIPYLTLDDEAKLKADLGRKHEEANKILADGDSNHNSNSAKKGLVPIPDDQKMFLINICENITEYLNSEEEKPLIIPPCNAFQRKLIFQTVEEKFPLIQIETKTGEKKERYMEVYRTKNVEDKFKKDQDKQALEKMELDIQVGFSKVIKAITASGKLVVGHNMFLDVIHAVDQFQCRLPEMLGDFKTVVKAVFPRLIDTKLMANTQPLQELIRFSSLEELKQTLMSKPFTPAKVETAEGFIRYEDGAGAFHEAGYDAYITGFAFATMVNYLGTLQSPPVYFTPPSSHIVNPFINKLFMMRINDIPYLNLDGPDLEVNRDHIFHVTFPKEWRPSDLHILFQPYGNIQISWLTDTTAYVSLYKKENAKLALKALSQSASTYHVVSYAFHHRSKNMRWSALATTPPASSPTPPHNKRKLQLNDSDIPNKVKRKSLCNESYPVIMEEDESLETSIEGSDLNITNSHIQNRSAEAASTDIEKKDAEKLFVEPDNW